MAIHIELSKRSFAILERLPENTGLDLFKLIDRLRFFPEIGTPLEIQFPDLAGYRQLIYKKRLRVVYRYAQQTETVYVILIIGCRQEMPDRRELSRDIPPNEELPLE